MDNRRMRDRNLVRVAWGLAFIWWGITMLFKFLPSGTVGVGEGLILLGLNAARRLNGIPTSGFTITLGILGLVLGGIRLAESVLRLPYELPDLAIVLIVLGVILLAREVLRVRRASFGI